MKVKLRSNSKGVINIPPEVIEYLGWKINDTVRLIICEEWGRSGRNGSYKTITLENEKDIDERDL